MVEPLILTAHQPVYIPWLGLFHKIALAEKFCVFDKVQYQTYDYNSRNRIKTRSGPIWLSVPVESKKHTQKLICDIKIVGNGWNRKHVRSLRYNYRGAPFFKDYIDAIEDKLLGTKYAYLTDLNTDMLVMFLAFLGIEVPLVKASDHDFVGKKSDLVLDMCLRLKANDFIFGQLGKAYADVASFSRRGINVYFQKYIHPVYPQIHGEFASYMSIVDLLFNAGPASRGIIMSGNAASVAGLEKGSDELPK